MTYDATYLNIKNMFGKNPEEILVNYSDKIDKNHKVLDVGAGQGRNSFFLAQNGFDVVAIDISVVSIKSILETAGKKNLKIKAVEVDFLTYKFKEKKFSAIMIFGLFQMLNWSAIKSFINKAKKMLIKDGVIFLTALGTKDDSYGHYVKNWIEIGRNSFYTEESNFRTYLEKNEILDYFSEFEILHHYEGLGKEHKHGKGPIEQHYIVELVAKNSDSD